MQVRTVTWRHLIGTLAVAGLAWLAYAPILGAYFEHDDFWWLETARKWAAGAAPLTYAPTPFVAFLYSLLYYFLYHTWGLNPYPYFLALLLCHVLDSCLVLALVWLLTGRFLAGLTAGLVFAVLFSHQQAVTWIAGGPHVFTLAGILLALICWVLYRRGRGWCLPLAILFALVATFTKDSGIAVIPMLLALDLAAFREARRRDLAWLGLPVLALVAWGVLFPPADGLTGAGSFSLSVGLRWLWSLIHVPPQMLVPALWVENYQHVLQRRLPPGAVSAVLVAAHGAVLLLSALAVWGVARGSALVRTGLLWCYLGFLPFLPLASSSYDFSRALRYLYIPSIGLALLAGVAAVAIAGRTRPGFSAGRVIAVVLFLSYLTGSFWYARHGCAHLLADSAQRRLVIATVVQRLPHPEPGAQIALRGLPAYLDDVQRGLPLLYAGPVVVRVSRGPVKPEAYLFRFDEASPGRLLEFRRPLTEP